MLYNVDSFDNKQYIFTNSRINTIGQLLWKFDENKVYKTHNDRSGFHEYYEFRLDNSDLSMVLLKEDLDVYVEQDKYSFLILSFIIQNSPQIFRSNNKSLLINEKLIKKEFNVDLKKITKQEFIESVKKLLNIRITFQFLNDKNERMTGITTLIQDVIYNEDIEDKECIVDLSKWISILFKDVKFIRSNFHPGTIDYNPFIKGGNKKSECMNLPQKFVELYRANENKEGIKTYQNNKYFEEIFNTKKVLRRKFIEGVINNINDALSKAGLRLVFDCDYTPKKFKEGNFQICLL